MLVVSKDLIDKFTDCLACGIVLSEGIGKTLDGWCDPLIDCCQAYRSYQQHQDFLKTLDLSEYKKTDTEGGIESPYLVGIRTDGRDGNQHRWCNMRETLFVDKYNKVTSLLKPECVYAAGGVIADFSRYDIKTGGLCSILTSRLANASVRVGGSLTLSRSSIVDSNFDITGNCVVAGAYLDNVYIKADCDVCILGGTLRNTKIMTSTPLVIYADTWSRGDDLIACASGGYSCIDHSELAVGRNCTVELFTQSIGISNADLKLEDCSSTLVNSFGLCREVITNSGDLSLLSLLSGAGYRIGTTAKAHKTVAAGAKLRVRLLEKGHIGILRADEGSCCSITTVDKIDTVWVRKGRSAAIASPNRKSRRRKVLVV